MATVDLVAIHKQIYDTRDYEDTGSLATAKLHREALLVAIAQRPESISKETQSVRYSMRGLELLLKRVDSWIASKDAGGYVKHVDFTDFRQ